MTTRELATAPKPTLNPALKSFWRIPARIRVLFGGRASTKSWDAAGFAIFLADNYTVKFLCVRQFQNKISESVYTLLKIQIERFGLKHRFRILRDRIVNIETGSEFIFYGLWRHIDEIKSTESIDICWIEEAHNLTEEQWRILEPTLRSDASQFWIVFNPKLVTDFVYRKFVTGTPETLIRDKVFGEVNGTIKRKINYTENPFLSKTLLRVIEKTKREDLEEYNHVYGGEPIEDDDQVIIKRSWVRAAIDAHKVLGLEPTGRKRIGFDIADSGVDKNATVSVHGFHVYAVDEWKGGEDELLKSATRVHSRAVFTQSEISYDSIGIGAFAGSHFEALNAKDDCPFQVDHHKFNAGGAVINPDDLVDAENPTSPTNGDFYHNIKAQAWWDVSRRFQHTFNAITKGYAPDPDRIISISSDCEHLESLIDELSTPRKDVSLTGKSKVESKKDLEKREVPSPNKADAFICAFAPTETGPAVAVFLSAKNRG
ncbi:MAG: PBSX family phage terminase large subunit [Pseudomonadota bacterium]